MIVTTHQPIFLPWPGFLAKAISADVMVLLDDVQFPLGRSWMTRNRLKGDQGELWLHVPVWKKGRGKQPIRKVEICEERDWRSKHLESIRQHYANAPYLCDLLPGLESIYSLKHRLLADLNVELIRFFLDRLGIQTQLLLQSALGVAGTGTNLLTAICTDLKAGTYVTLPPVEKYLDAKAFDKNAISLQFVRFTPPVYPQLWGEFRANLSVLDLILNCGSKAFDIIRTSTRT